MTFDEWWEATKNFDKVEIPGILKKAIKEFAYEVWCESRYQQKIMEKSSEKVYLCPYCKLEYTKPEGAKTCCVNRKTF